MINVTLSSLTPRFGSTAECRTAGVDRQVKKVVKVLRNGSYVAHAAQHCTVVIGPSTSRFPSARVSITRVK